MSGGCETERWQWKLAEVARQQLHLSLEGTPHGDAKGLHAERSSSAVMGQISISAACVSSVVKGEEEMAVSSMAAYSAVIQRFIEGSLERETRRNRKSVISRGGIAR